MLSSAFESGVALCHFALLAATLSCDVAHGLGTFTRLAEDVLQPPFADLIAKRGWRVSTRSCQKVGHFITIYMLNY